MDDVFHFKPPRSKKSQYDLLQDAIKTLEKLEYEGLANKLKAYVDNRQGYINNHMGKYIQITDNKVTVIDKTSISDLTKYDGIIMKIGSEVASSDVACLYSVAYDYVVVTYRVPISFWYGDRSTNTDNAIVDTGCTRTTFSTQVLDWIKHYNPTYAVQLESVDVIGGKTTVLKGTISVKLCGRKYERLDVNYASIPCVALIGMDLINTGKLDIDSGKRLTFTYH